MTGTCLQMYVPCNSVSVLPASCVFTCWRVVVVCVSHLNVWLSLMMSGMRCYSESRDTLEWEKRQREMSKPWTWSQWSASRQQWQCIADLISDVVTPLINVLWVMMLKYLHSARIMYHNNSIQPCSCYCLCHGSSWVSQGIGCTKLRSSCRQLPAVEVSPSSSSVGGDWWQCWPGPETVHCTVQLYTVQCRWPGEHSLISLLRAITPPGPVSHLCAPQCINSTCTTQLCSVRARIACSPTTSEIARKSLWLSVCRNKKWNIEKHFSKLNNNNLP